MTTTKTDTSTHITEALISVVARDIALGSSLEDVAILRQVPLKTLEKLVRGALFKKRLSKLQEELNQQYVAEMSEDPVQAKLRALSLKAVSKLDEEMDNYDKEGSGATSSTRIKAANSLLDRAGVVGKKEDSGNTVVLQLSMTKMEGIKKSISDLNDKILEEIPDCVDGL